jgi:hypothetical protein
MKNEKDHRNWPLGVGGQKKALPPNAGRGRRPGVPNKIGSELRALILEALDKAGAEDYLAKQAHENPTAFLTLLSKLIPRTPIGDAQNAINLQVVTGVPESVND